MRLKCISNKRGIYFIYDGSKYVIYSEFYGVVAVSTEINREIEDKVIIDFDICDWHGYWGLKPIITKGIRAEETMYIDKDVVINYNIVGNQAENQLNKYLKFELLDR